MSDISERVDRILAEHLGVTGDKITPEARLREDLGADSLDAVELVMALEEEFGCDVDDEEMESVVTVADLVVLAARTIDAGARQPAPEAQAPKEGRKRWWASLMRRLHWA